MKQVNSSSISGVHKKDRRRRNCSDYRRHKEAREPVAARRCVCSTFKNDIDRLGVFRETRTRNQYRVRSKKWAEEKIEEGTVLSISLKFITY